MTEQKLEAAVKFLREYNTKANLDLYQRAVLRFCSYVEEYMKEKSPGLTTAEVSEAML